MGRDSDKPGHQGHDQKLPKLNTKNFQKLSTNTRAETTTNSAIPKTIKTSYHKQPHNMPLYPHLMDGQQIYCGGINHGRIATNKGIGDAGNTADFRMLWSAMVCLGLL